MVIQLEDCVDCIQGIFWDQYDVIFMFDHSSGHAKKGTNDLDASAIMKRIRLITANDEAVKNITRRWNIGSLS